MKEQLNGEIIVSKFVTPDGTILHSHHRHDYASYKDENGKTYFLDGGTEYQRVSGNITDCTDLSCHYGDPHEVVRERYDWGTYGVDGKGELKFILLKDLTTNHIKAILSTQKQIREVFRQVFIDELYYRGEDYAP